ncbi:chromate transporter [Calorimonas adulescens]|uniref:Chromate transporter n=1 Tax=Calorimonas adulescens TaxID=2606906 RepID=A0A5D8QHZ2_9THEO|nr:chromate transporter [Calorimonas adulescens]TZE82918.1 chromate transporter [Calorimonas adulescens]
MKFLFELMMSFFKIGAFTLGGGYAMVPLIQEEVVEKKGWIDESEFLNIIAIAQSAPGPIAINTAVFTGYRLKGISGAVFATLGAVLPSFLIILIVATFFLSVKDSAVVKRAFMGIRPAVVALIVYSVVRLVKSNDVKGYAFIIPLLACLGIVLFNLHPILIIVLAAISGIIKTIVRGEDMGE